MVGIGSPIQDVEVPLTDVLIHQTNVVFLGFAAFEQRALHHDP